MRNRNSRAACWLPRGDGRTTEGSHISYSLLPKKKSHGSFPLLPFQTGEAHPAATPNPKTQPRQDFGGQGSRQPRDKGGTAKPPAVPDTETKKGGCSEGHSKSAGEVKPKSAGFELKVAPAKHRDLRTKAS